MFEIECEASNAPKFLDWIKNRGGVALWRSINLSNPGASWSSPAKTLEGSPTPQPTWEAGKTPEKVITDPEKIVVFTSKVVKRFHVGVRTGSQGLSLKVTDGGSRRIRKEVEKAGKGAYHVFDYGDYENAVIMASDKEISLADWAQNHAE